MKKTWSFNFTVLFLLVILASPALAYEEGSVANGGSISGKITFSGKAPAPRMIKIDKDTRGLWQREGITRPTCR